MTDSSSTSEGSQASWTRRSLALFAGRGRPAALLVLVLLVGLQLVAGDAAFDAVRRNVFDGYQRLFPRVRMSAPAVIVAIDEASLTRFGQWPWPRHLMADLVARILAEGPAALGVDILMPEPDRLSPSQWARRESDIPPELAARLLALPDHDRRLAETIAGSPTVVGMAASMDDIAPGAGPLTAVRAIGGDPASALPRYPSLVRNVPEIEAAAAGHGLLSVVRDVDGVIRRLPMIAIAGSVPVPGLATEMLRLAAGSRTVTLRMGPGGAAGVEMNELFVPTEPDGSIRIHFSPHDDARFVSAADVLSGSIAKDTFDGRLVVLGLTGIGLLDLAQTPVGPMPGAEVHVQALENVVDGQLASRPAWAPALESGLSLAAGLVLVAFLPLLRLPWYAAVAAVIPLGFGAAGLGFWVANAWLIDAAGPALVSGASFVALLGGGFAEADRQRRRLRLELEEQRLRAARLAGELEAARRIQLGILPRPESLPTDNRFELCALMEPAKEVGGDLYDFFMVDRDHLFFAIGDVSGKGVPASLFMALGKALYKSCVLRGERDIGVIMETANAEISRDNAEMLFITVFAGLLDVSTGELRFCNAGHDAPLVAAPGRSPRALDVPGGPPLCVVDEFPYVAETGRLEPGDILCLVTDGVTEAMNPAGELMGRARVADALAGITGATRAADVVRNIRASVGLFVAGAEPSDDLTLLAVRWYGPAVSAP